MRLTTVGTGTAAPSPSRVQSGHYVEEGAARLLLDCGSGVAFRMAALGLDWQGITHVALTHFHPDHISDLATLLQAWRHGQSPARTAPLEVLGPVGTAELLSRVGALFGEGLLTPGFDVRIRELQPGEITSLNGAATLEAHKVPHTAESVAYSVRNRRRRIVYTGDTGPDRKLAGWSEGCDLLLCECSLPAALAIPTHLTPEQCGAMAAIARPGLLALTHFYPPVEREDVPALVGEHYAGPLVCANDGWTIDLEGS